MVDTNTLIENPEIIKQYDVVILSHVYREIEKLKLKENTSYKARVVSRYINEYCDSNNFDFKDYKFTLNEEFDPLYEDNKILQALVENKDKYCLVTYDTLLKFKAKGYGIDVVELEDKQSDYKGYREVTLDEFELANFYECMINKWNLLENEYLILKDLEGNVIDCKKYTKHGFKDINKKTLKSVLFGDKIKAKDVYQEIAFDSLINDKFTIISGLAGSGKSLLSLVYCSWALQNNKYDKLIIAFNPTKTRGASEMGFYSGNVVEKGLQQFIGNMLNSKFGDPMVVHGLINQGKLQLVPISDIRGMEITDNQILYITEAQNLSIDLCKTCIQRVSEHAKVIFEGDIKTQVDNRLFEGNNNGLKRAIEVFKGESMFGYVDLPNIYRSRIAEIAERM